MSLAQSATHQELPAHAGDATAAAPTGERLTVLLSDPPGSDQRASSVDERADSLEQLELELLLEAIRRHYGIDFAAYARSTLTRRVRRHLAKTKIRTVSGLLERVLHDRSAMTELLADLSVSFTAMFRDPEFFRALRRDVLPELRRLPLLRIWHAGCATGEEVYSMCILLREEGLYRRSRLYATDLSEKALAEARLGIFPGTRIKEYTENYVLAGGHGDFSAYYSIGSEGAVFDPRLVENVLFAPHDLVSDGVFAQVNLIVCRNVLIYFGRELKERAIHLCRQSLTRDGILCLGNLESLRGTTAERYFSPLNEQESIYRRCR